MIAVDLPEPGEAEKQHSQRLCDLIKQQIKQAGGWLSFDQYMQSALYTPGLGYYSSGLHKFGEFGDFITSPEISPLFAQTLANPVSSLLASLAQAKIIEFGAGSGRLAVDLLKALQIKQQLPEAYWIVELSADLQQRQRQLLQQQVPDLLDRVEWLSSLPETPVNAVVIANEVLDAMPVKRFKINNQQIAELGVEVKHDSLALTYRAADEQLQQQIMALDMISAAESYDYCSEINLNIKPWIRSVAECIEQGGLYLIDYGYTRAEYYSAERHMGTSIGYYHHRVMDSPLWYPGLQDLTAFVDFTEVAEAALEYGFDVDGFTSQGNFLINCGLADIVEKSIVEKAMVNNETQYLQLLQQMKTLSLPGEMGERFKVIGLSKGLDKNIAGFEVRDLRYSL